MSWSLFPMMLLLMSSSLINGQYVLINNTNVVVSSQSPQTVSFSLTSPILCGDPHAYCAVDILITNNRPDEIFIDNCHITFTRDSWYLPQYLVIKPVEQYLSGGVIQTSLTLGKIISNSEYYSNIQLPNITIHSTTMPSGSCSGTGDPHYTTFDGFYWHIYPSGSYVLASSTKRDFEVQVKTVGYPAQHCGFASHENGDIVVIDACSGSISLRRTCSTVQCLTSTGFPKITTTSGSFSTYTVTMASGAIIQLAYYTSYQGNMYITVPGLDYKSLTGICGNFNGQGNDDLPSTMTSNVCTSISQLNGNVLPKIDLFSWYPNGGNNQNVINSKSINCPYNPPSVIYSLINSGNSEDITTIIKSSVPILHDNPLSVNIFDNSSQTGNGMLNGVLNENLTEHNILTYCTEGLQFINYQCSSINNLNVNNYIKNCVDDAMFGVPIDMSLAVSQHSYQSDCLSQVTFNITLRNSDIVNNLCQLNCSGTGICLNGNCQCFEGYIGNDCSINQNLLPTITSISPNICDRSCTQNFIITGNGFWPSNWTCVFYLNNTDLKIETNAVYLSGFSIVCPIQNSFSNLVENGGINNLTYSVSISNSTVSGNEKPLTLTFYDSRCIGNVSCIIDSQCYTENQLNPNNQCWQCQNTNHWSAVLFNNICNPIVNVNTFLTLNQPLTSNVIVYSFPSINENSYINGLVNYSIQYQSDFYITAKGDLISLISQPNNQSIIIKVNDADGRITYLNITLLFIKASILNISLTLNSSNKNMIISQIPCINNQTQSCILYGSYEQSVYTSIDVDNGNIILNTEIINFTLPNLILTLSQKLFSIDSFGNVYNFIVYVNIKCIYTTESTSSPTTQPTFSSQPTIQTTLFKIPTFSNRIITTTSKQFNTDDVKSSTIPFQNQNTTYKTKNILCNMSSDNNVIYINNNLQKGNTIYNINCINPLLYTFNINPEDLFIDINEYGMMTLLRNLTYKDNGIYNVEINIFDNQEGSSLKLSHVLFFEINILTSKTPSSTAIASTDLFMIVFFSILSVLFILLIVVVIVKKHKNKGKVYTIPLVTPHDFNTSSYKETNEITNPLYMSFYNSKLDCDTAEYYLKNNDINFVIFNNSETPEWHNLALKIGNNIYYEKICQYLEGGEMVYSPVKTLLSKKNYNNINDLVNELTDHHSNTIYDNFRLKKWVA